MANLGYVEINTNGDYVDIATATGLTFTEGTKYSLQVQNRLGYLTVCALDSTPTEGGVILKDLEKFDYTPVSGVDCYLKTPAGGTVSLNIQN